MAGEDTTREIMPLLEGLLEKHLECNKANAEVAKARANLEAKMIEMGVQTVTLPQTNPDGTPGKNIIARIDPVSESGVDTTKLESLLTEEEKKPFTKFSVSIDGLEKALKAGDIARATDDELSAISGCIIRRATGKKKLVVQNLPKE